MSKISALRIPLAPDQGQASLDRLEHHLHAARRQLLVCAAALSHRPSLASEIAMELSAAVEKIDLAITHAMLLPRVQS